MFFTEVRLVYLYLAFLTFVFTQVNSRTKIEQKDQQPLYKMILKVYIPLNLILWCSSVNMQTYEEPSTCVIIQDKESVFVNTPLPSFLRDRDKSQCQVQNPDQEFLRCGDTNVYIKPECVCSFHNVYEATRYHKYTSCPDDHPTDVVTQLKCSDCKKYSLNNKGPCINGGILICKGEGVAPTINCTCPPNYGGMFCENKIENVTRICFKNSSAKGLMDCAKTGRECVTYSKNKLYAYKCEETDISNDRSGLPLCIDTEEVPVDESYRNISQRSGYISMGCKCESAPDVRWAVLMLLKLIHVHI